MSCDQGLAERIRRQRQARRGYAGQHIHPHFVVPFSVPGVVAKDLKKRNKLCHGE
jgi:hypothetical protein